LSQGAHNRGVVKVGCQEGGGGNVDEKEREEMKRDLETG